MIKIKIPFGEEATTLQLDDDRPREVVAPKQMPADEDAIVKSLAKPSSSAPFDSFIGDRRRILVVVNDHTRPTPTAQVLKHLDLKGNSVTTIVAAGAHRTPTSAELEKILAGPEPPYGGTLVFHDARRSSSLRLLGRTSRGTNVQLNRCGWNNRYRLG